MHNLRHPWDHLPQPRRTWRYCARCWLAQEPRRVDREVPAAPADRLFLPHALPGRTPDGDTHALLEAPRPPELAAARAPRCRNVCADPRPTSPRPITAGSSNFEAAAPTYAYEYEVHGEKLSEALRRRAFFATRVVRWPLRGGLRRGNRDGGGVFAAISNDVFAEVDVLLRPRSAPWGEAPQKGASNSTGRRRGFQCDLDPSPGTAVCGTLPAGNGRQRGCRWGSSSSARAFRDEGAARRRAGLGSRAANCTKTIFHVLAPKEGDGDDLRAANLPLCTRPAFLTLSSGSTHSPCRFWKKHGIQQAGVLDRDDRSVPKPGPLLHAQNGSRSMIGGERDSPGSRADPGMDLLGALRPKKNGQNRHPRSTNTESCRARRPSRR